MIRHTFRKLSLTALLLLPAAAVLAQENPADAKSADEKTEALRQTVAELEGRLESSVQTLVEMKNRLDEATGKAEDYRKRLEQVQAESETRMQRRDDEATEMRRKKAQQLLEVQARAEEAEKRLAAMAEELESSKDGMRKLLAERQTEAERRGERTARQALARKVRTAEMRFRRAEQALAAGLGRGADVRVWRDATATEERIRIALAEPVSFNFLDTPLKDMLAYFHSLTDIDIFLDERGLSRADIGADEPITLSLDGVALESALELVLADLGLDYVVDNDVLEITDAATVARMAETRLYDVRNLAKAGEAQEILVRKVRELAAPDATADRDAVVTSAGDGLLAARLNPRGHRRVARLLRMLKAATKPQVKDADSEAADGPAED